MAHISLLYEWLLWLNSIYKLCQTAALILCIKYQRQSQSRPLLYFSSFIIRSLHDPIGVCIWHGKRVTNRRYTGRYIYPHLTIDRSIDIYFIFCHSPDHSSTGYILTLFYLLSIPLTNQIIPTGRKVWLFVVMRNHITIPRIRWTHHTAAIRI